MKHAIYVGMFTAALGMAMAAQAQDAAPATAPLQVSQLRGITDLRSSDGRRIGPVYAVDQASDGSPADVQIIEDMRIIHIPASTITLKDKRHAVTSMTYHDAMR